MLRVAAAIVGAWLMVRPPAAGAQVSWSAAVNGGYSAGIGEDFGGPGGPSIHGFVYQPISRNVDLGAEIGWHGLGTETTRIPNLYGPGSLYREDFSESLGQLTIGARVRPGGGRARAYISAGGGAYFVRFRDEIEVRDSGGQVLPQYDFRNAGSDLYPGINLGVGADRLVLLGNVGLGLHARWHGLIGGDIASVFSISLGIALH
jgi:hypothetical protein